MKRTHRLLSLLLCLVMALSLLPATAVTAFAAAPTGEAVLGGFTAGGKAGDAYIQNDGMKILDATGTDGKNPMYSESKVGQTATLSPYCPPYGMTQHPKYVYNDYNATAIVAEETGRRLLRNDTFKAATTYRFTFQDTSWPVNRSIKGGGYLGELTEDNFTIEGAEVVKVERVAQQLNLAKDYEMQGFFYNIWIKIDGEQNNYEVQYADNNITSVSGLTSKSESPKVTGYAKEGDEITLTAAKVKAGSFFTGWKFTTDDGKFYTSKDYIQWYCNVTEYTSNEGGSDKVTCSFRMGDKNLYVEALYSTTGNVTFNSINLNITQPIKGGQPFTSIEPVYDSAIGAAYRVDGYKWYDTQSGLAGGQPMESTSTFALGDTSRRYALTVTLKLNDRYVFDTSNPTVTINGQKYEKGNENTGAYRLHEALCVGGYPVSYRYFDGTNSGSRAIVLTIPLDAGTKDWLYDQSNGADFRKFAALKFVDAPSIEVTVTRPGSGNPECGSATTSDFTMELEQGINYSVNVKVKVPQAIQTAIDSGLMQMLPQFRYLLNSAAMGTNLWQGSQVTDSKDGSDTIYTYSTNFSPVAGESYMLVFGTNLVTTGADAQRIAGNIISGTFSCVNTKITDGPTLTGNTLKAGATSGPTLTVAADALYTVGDTVTGWDISEENLVVNGKTYWTMICLNPKPGYVFDPDYDYTPDVTLDGAAAKTNYAVAVDGSAMFLTVYATATHEHVMGFVDNGEGYHIYKCTVPGCYSYNGYKEAHIWGEGTVSGDGDKIIYTCEKCPATTEVLVTVEDKTILGFSANVTTPKAGDTVGDKARVTFNDKFNEQLNRDETKIEWKQGETVLNETDVFEVGKTYTITVIFTAAEGYKFYEDNTFNVLWNSDVKPDAHQTYGGGSKTVTQSMTFTVKQSVAATVTMPGLKAGDTLPALTIDPADKLDTAGYCSAAVARAGTTTLYEYKYAATANAWKWYKDSVEVENIPLQAGDEVAYWWNFIPPGANEFNMTVNSEGATNLTTIYSLPTGAILAAYTIPAADDAKAISKVALTVSGYEYGKSVSAAAKGTDPANVTTGAWNWNPNDTTFGAKAYTVTIPVTPADGYTFASGCLFTVNGYPAVYDAEKGAVTCTLPELAAPHTHDFGGWTYLNDAVHYHKCDCGTTEMKEHNWVKTGEVEATTTATGSVTYKCSDCGEEKTETTPKLPETVDPGKPDQPTRPTQPERPNRRPGSGSGTGSTAKSNKDVKSGNTGDAGIALYAGLALLSVSGGAWTFSRKRKENDR